MEDKIDFVMAGPQDYEEVAALYRELLERESPFTRQFYEDALSLGTTSVTLARNGTGRAVALAAWTVWPPSLSFPKAVFFIQDLIVAPSHRRRGIGRRLVNYIRENAAEEGINIVHLQADVHDSLAFYEACGFKALNAGLFLYTERD